MDGSHCQLWKSPNLTLACSRGASPRKFFFWVEAPKNSLNFNKGAETPEPLLHDTSALYPIFIFPYDVNDL